MSDYTRTGRAADAAAEGLVERALVEVRRYHGGHGRPDLHRPLGRRLHGDRLRGFDDRLDAHLPLARRLLLVKADGSVLVHSDGGSYKPLNWMSPPCTLKVREPEADEAAANQQQVSEAQREADERDDTDHPDEQPDHPPRIEAFVPEPSRDHGGDQRRRGDEQAGADQRQAPAADDRRDDEQHGDERGDAREDRRARADWIIPSHSLDAAAAAVDSICLDILSRRPHA